MEIKVKNKSESTINLEIKVPSEEFKKFVKKATTELGKDLEAEGFRKGKVPSEVVQNKVGMDEILQKAARLAVQEKYTEAVEEKNIDPVGQPSIEITKLAQGSPLEFEAKIPVVPDFELPDYKKIASEVEKKEINISDEEVADALTWLRKSRANLNEVSRKAEEGDFVNVEFESGKLDLQKQDGFILGEGQFIPGFEEKIIGMKPGEEKEFTLELPEEHFKEEMAGQEADFKVKLNKVQEMELPEITDEWAQSLGHFSSVKALRVSLKQNLKKEKEQKENQRVQQKVLDKVSDKTEIKIPDELVTRERSRMLANLKNRFTQNKEMSFEDYLEQTGQDLEKIKESLKEEAEGRIKRTLILREIAKKEDIEVSEEEVEKEVDKMLKDYPKEQAEKVDPEQLKGYTEERLMNQKTLEKLVNSES